MYTVNCAIPWPGPSMRTCCMLYTLHALANIHFCSCRLIVAGWSRSAPRYKLVGSHTVYGYSGSHRKKFQNAIKIFPKLIQMAAKIFRMASQMGHRDTILIPKLRFQGGKFRGRNIFPDNKRVLKSKRCPYCPFGTSFGTCWKPFGPVWGVF